MTLDIADVAGHAVRFGRPGAVSFTANGRAGTVVRLATGCGATAEIALLGGHVLSYATPACGDVLWLSPVARPDPGKALRGGIPVCWPWFAAHPTDPGRSAHGVARSAPWRVVATQGGAAPRVLLQLDEAAAGASGLPLQARLEVTLGAALTVALTTQNEGPQPVRLTSALHTYFRVSDIAGIAIEGLAGRPFIDKLDADRIKTEAAPIRFAGELDRIYQDTPDRVAIVDVGLGRRILVDKSGSRSTVVWNPWAAKAERLGDLGPDGYRRMVCVETANAGADVVELAPGAAHTLSATLAVEPLA